MTHESPEPAASLPVAAVDRWLAPVTRFLHVEASSGVVLLACTAFALAIANSPLAGWFASLWKTPVSLSVGGFALSGDVGHLLVNDGFMIIFFFVVGLEVKREIVHGELGDLRKALLPAGRTQFAAREAISPLQRRCSSSRSCSPKPSRGAGSQPPSGPTASRRGSTVASNRSGNPRQTVDS